MDEEMRVMWERRKVAVFLNCSYESVLKMPYDDFLRARKLQEIESLCHTESGMEVLKNNIRYSQTSPDIDKLRKRYRKEDLNG